MKKILLLIITILIISSSYAAKSKLSVLYVGWNPEHPEQHIRKGYGSKAVFEEKKLRWSDFKKFLNTYFKSVKMVHHWDYNSKMSEGYDVTVFDAMPKKIKGRVTEKDADGNYTKFEYEHYIPEDFSAAAITLNTMTERTRYSVKHKLDWC